LPLAPVFEGLRRWVRFQRKRHHPREDAIWDSLLERVVRIVIFCVLIGTFFDDSPDPCKKTRSRGRHTLSIYRWPSEPRNVPVARTHAHQG